MADISNILGGDWSPPSPHKVGTPEEQLIDAMVNADTQPPRRIIMDGKIHRFNSDTTGKHHNSSDKPGWYIAFKDSIAAGMFGCWRMGIEQRWHADIGRSLTPEEESAMRERMEHAKKQRDEELKKYHDETARAVQAIWAAASPANEDHPYLKKKGIKTHGAKISGEGKLIVPMYNKEGILRSVQYIHVENEKTIKKNQKGGEVSGNFWVLGNIDTDGPVYLAEGYATAATIREVTNRPCVVAYSAHNLISVTQSIKELFTGIEMVIVADHDSGGVGQRCAEEAASKTGARVIVVPIESMDANDYALAGHDLKSLLMSKRFKLLTGADLEARPPLKWRIKGVLPAVGMAQIYGPSRSGKSFLAFDMACAVADGERWFGYRVHKTPVVYVILEGEAGFKLRAEAWKTQYQKPLPKDLYFIMQPFHINQRMDVSELSAVIPYEAVVIVDTQNRAAPDADENNGKDMGMIIDGAKQLQAAINGMVILVAHTGKDVSKGPRGHSSQIPTIDAAIEVSRSGDDRSWKADKVKDGEDGKEHGFRLVIHQLGLDEDGDPLTSCSVERAESIVIQKKDSKLEEYKLTFKSAWFDCGAEEQDGFPYLTRSAMMEYLMSTKEVSPKTAEKYVKPSSHGFIIADLIDAKIIQAVRDGWIVTDEGLASVMLLSKNAKTD